MDGARIVEEERRRLALLKKEKGEWLAKWRELEDFQTKVSEILHSFMEEGQTAEKKEILSSLCGSGYSVAEKESAADGLKRLVEQAYDEKMREIDRLNLAAEELNRKLNIQEKILEDCKNTETPMIEYRIMWSCGMRSTGNLNRERLEAEPSLPASM